MVCQYYKMKFNTLVPNSLEPNSIYALLLSSHRVFVLNMHLSLCYCALLVACSDNHLLYYMIIVVIFM